MVPHFSYAFKWIKFYLIIQLEARLNYIFDSNFVKI